MNQETGLQLTLLCTAGSFVRTVQTEMGQGKEREKTRGNKSVDVEIGTSFYQRSSNFPIVVV